MKVTSPTGVEIVGTADTIRATALIASFTGRTDDGELEFDYSGQTDIDWNAQKVLMRRKRRLFVDANGHEWPENKLVVSEDSDS